jgi:hypothetical protein
VGLLSQAQNLGIDGSDTLYIADTGNKQIRKLDSSGVINSIATNLSASPWGVTADPAGVVWFTEPGANAIFNINPDGVVAKATGTGTDPCAQGDSCLLSNESVINPRSITIGVNGGNAGLAEQTKGAAQIQFWTSPPQLVRVSNPYTYATSTPGAFTFDPNGATFYASWITPTHCQIESGVQSGNPGATKIAGGSTCGFSGDGGKAGNAQLNKSVGQIAFDLAGNLYFTDTFNQRVRRIHEASNVIRTVAGSGNSGYSGDGGSALESTLSNPTGLAIDSQGAIYVISGDGHGLGKQVVRKIGPQGFLNFGSQVRNTAGAARLLTVSNTGTIGIDSGPAPMILTKAVITGANAADFSIDPNTSSCNLQTGSVLPAGNSCRIGVIFKPSATGLRTANLVLLDNTINGADTAILSGQGVLPSATLAITSPGSGQSFKSGTAITFTLDVTGSPGPSPTGTVQFKVDGTNYGAAVTLLSGKASTSVTGLSVANHTLSATYSGDSNYAPGGPVSIGVVVTAVRFGSIVSLDGAAGPPASCAAPAFVVKVSGASGSRPIATGEVELFDRSSRIASATLSNGSATLQPHIATGVHTLQAKYSGDNFYLPAVSLARVEMVSPAAPCARPVLGQGARP